MGLKEGRAGWSLKKKKKEKGPKKGYNEYSLNSVMLEEGNEDEKELGGRTKLPPWLKEGSEGWSLKKKKKEKGPKKGYNEYSLNSVMLEEGNEDEKELGGRTKLPPWLKEGSEG